MATMLRFALPVILGNLLQQCYNVADTLIVGQVLGSEALGAVGSSFTLMTFLTSILLGLCMGSGAAFSIRFGQRDEAGLKQDMGAAFVLIAAITLVLTLLSFAGIEEILWFLRVPGEIQGLMRGYLLVIFWGIPATFLYNYFAAALRAVGNSVVPLYFLGVSALVNIALDLWFVLGLGLGVAGAALATVIAQYLSGLGIALYFWLGCPKLRMGAGDLLPHPGRIRAIAGFSLLTCVQQSVMNLGILMVQGLVNSFGPAVMAAFAAAVKIDAFAYLPVQDFGNAFSSFIAQNYGAREEGRIRAGFRGAVLTALIYCLAASLVVCLLARPLMLLFVRPEETAVIAEGVRYLRIEGAFYWGIGWLSLLYGLYRALGRPGMSVVLTVCLLSPLPALGVVGIWMSVPIGWCLADGVGMLYYRARRDRLLPFPPAQP